MKFQAPNTKHQTPSAKLFEILNLKPVRRVEHWNLGFGISKRVRKFIAFCLFLLLFTAIPILAVEEATPSLEIKEKIKERLEKTATDSAQSTQEEKKDGRYYAWVGTLVKVEGQSLFVGTEEGEKEAVVDKETTILQTEKGKREEVELADLKKGNFIIAIGTKEGEKINATRVISTPPLSNNYQKEVIYSKVIEIEEEKITLGNGESTVLPIGKKTALTIKGLEKAKVADIQLEDKIYAVVIKEKDKITQTSAIFVIPGKYSPENETKRKLEEVSPATPSSKTASPSPSASSEE